MSETCKTDVVHVYELTVVIIVDHILGHNGCIEEMFVPIIPLSILRVPGMKLGQCISLSQAR